MEPLFATARRAMIAMPLVLAILLPASGFGATDEREGRPARLQISGYGWFGDLKLKRNLRLLQQGTNRPTYFDAAFVEDGALIMFSKLRDDGYLSPVITARLTLDDGERVSYVWDESVEEPLPGSIQAAVVHFRVRKGVLYHFQKLEFSGLTAIPEKEARGYFIETGGLVQLKQNRIYSPDRLRRGIASLTSVLQREGYQSVTVSATEVRQSPRTGAVTVQIKVDEGPRHMVRSVREEIYYGTNAVASEIRLNAPAKPYSKLWEQDFVQGVRTNYYRRGYPDTTIEMITVGRERGGDVVELDLRALVRTGPRIRVGDISFSGNHRTKEAVLERRVNLVEGEWLDRVRAERGRHRMSRLGIFESVELRYDPVDELTRNIVYNVKEGKRVEVSLLLGYGSYELLRGGVIVDQFNVFGLAHHQQLRLVQSFKASKVDYTYTMPELLGENMDVFITGSGLRREEVSFTRVEYGGGAGVRRYFHRTGTDVSMRYNYGILQATRASVDFAEEGLRNPTVGSIISDMRMDRRDNPLFPRSGYQLLGNLEVATEYLGGEVNFQRIELGGSYHTPLFDSQWIHVGLRHGVVASVAGSDEDLPFARRFFPGGENSVRGFTEGEASPRDSEGRIVGAETYLSGNFEFEQGVTPKWSLIAFVDAVTFARKLSDYPGDEFLVSVGGGVRWKTFIGPVRLEYGHNLNPRSRDPAGTIHFSLGFPF